MGKNNITSDKILDLLSFKHQKDVFIPECKVGPSISSSSIRLDAWVMKKSWTHFKTTGYEIKVSRSDFLNDNKWRGYLDYCNEFYFVCPPKLILPQELPNEAGLMYVSSTGNKLYTKRKAPHRKVDIPINIFIYILMWRTQVVDRYDDEQANVEYFKQWVEQKRYRKELGYRVSQGIKEYCAKLEAENWKLRSENENLNDIKDRIEELGFNPHSGVVDWIVKKNIDKKLKELKNDMPQELIDALITLRKKIDKALNLIR